MEKYVKLLRSKSLKVTPQRLEILRYLDRKEGHPSVEVIYNSLKETNPSLSHSTVYNTLSLFEKYGIVQALTITPGEIRYSMDTHMHHHFLCKRCSGIFDVEVSCPYLDTTLNEGHMVEEVHGYMSGICSDCLARMGVSAEQMNEIAGTKDDATGATTTCDE